MKRNTILHPSQNNKTEKSVEAFLFGWAFIES